MDTMTDIHPAVVTAAATLAAARIRLREARETVDRLNSRLDDASAATSAAERAAVDAIAKGEGADDVAAMRAVSEATARRDAYATAKVTTDQALADAEAAFTQAEKALVWAEGIALYDQAAAGRDRLHAAHAEFANAFLAVQRPYDDATRKLSAVSAVSPPQSLVLSRKVRSSLYTAGVDLDLKGYQMPSPPVNNLAHAIDDAIAEAKRFIDQQGVTFPNAG